MEVKKNALYTAITPARKMTLESMRADFEYRMAQRITKKLLENNLISLSEYNRISDLNLENFSPFLAELLG